MAIVTKAELQAQLQQAQSQIQDLRDQLTQARQVEIHEVKRLHQEELARVNAEWQKKFDSEKSMKEYYSKSCDDRHKTISEMHDILDQIPAAPAKKEPDGYSERSISARLVGLLAVLAGLATSKRDPS